ncbi:TPA: VanZ family protein [Streptococcus suis]
MSTGISLAPSLKTYFSILLYWSLTSYSFCPLGCFFSFSWKKLSLFAGAILLVEACQFFFSLGFFDLGDILLNTSGFALGNLLGQSAIAQSFKNRIQKK